MSEFLVPAIYVALLILYAVGVQGITYRLLCVDLKTRLCPNAVFYELVIEYQADDWSTLKQRWATAIGSTGWLADCLLAPTAPRAAAQALLFCRYQQSYLNALRLVCSLGTLFGLMGTVCGFLIAEDISEVGLNTAFTTTFWGIVVTVPPAIYLGVTKSHRERIEIQIELFLERLRQAGTNRPRPVPPAPPPIASPSPVSDPTEG